jgi:hypothetical protein
MLKTVIEGDIEFLNRSIVIHSIDEVYKASSEEALEAIITTIEDKSKDWLVVEDYKGEIVVPKTFLGRLINLIRK